VLDGTTVVIAERERRPRSGLEDKLPIVAETEALWVAFAVVARRRDVSRGQLGQAMAPECSSGSNSPYVTPALQ
jgi:hypothetical protein